MARYPGVVTIFTTTTCPHCKAAKALLASKDVNLVMWEVDLYPPQAREEMSRIANGAKSVPQIFLNGKHLPGGNSGLQELEAQGKLDSILAEGLAEPPGADIPSIIVEKLPQTDEDRIPFGLGGLPPGAPEDVFLKKVLAEMRKEREFKKAFQGTVAVKWMTARKYEGLHICQRMRDLGVIADQSSTSVTEFSESNLYALSCLENLNVLNIDYNALKVAELKQARSAELIATSLRKRVLNLYQQFLSADGTSVDYIGIRTSYAFSVYCDVSAELQLIKIEEMAAFNENSRKAFFINLYNALAIHAFVTLGHPQSLFSRLQFFNSAAYRMGGVDWSLNMIEHGILRSNRMSPAGYLPFLRGSLFSSLPLISAKDPRISCVVETIDPRIHFALNCGAKSCPPIKLFSSANLNDELTLAAQAFFEDESNLQVDASSGSVKASTILKWYAKDFGESDLKVCSFISQYLSGKKKEDLEAVVDSGKVNLRYIPYDWGDNGKKSNL